LFDPNCEGHSCIYIYIYIYIECPKVCNDWVIPKEILNIFIFKRFIEKKSKLRMCSYIYIYIFNKRNSIKGLQGIIEMSNILQVNSLSNTRKRIEIKGYFTKK